MLNFFRKPNSGPEDIGRFIRDHASNINVSLCVFGDWFGRPGDNCHRLVSHEAKEDYVRLKFDEGETLEVWNPEGLRVDGRSFIIEKASRVRWEWFYYERPKNRQNRLFIEHLLVGERIEATTNIEWPPSRFAPSQSYPAVSIT